MDKVILLATELKNLRERVAAIVAAPTPLDGLQGLQGEAGKAGKDGAKGEQGSKGDKGDKSDAGVKGDTGEQGISIVNAEIDFDGTLSFQLSNGKSIKTTTEVVGSQGPRGVPGAKGEQGIQGPTGVTDDGLIYAFLFGAD